MLNDLNMEKVNFEWVPHTLNIAQQAARVEISWELFDFLEGRRDQSLCKVDTGDDGGIS
jgi:hypothetical protein